MSYYDILLAKQLSGGGGGGDITVESLSVTANGTYSAPSGKAYSPVVANVPNSYTASDEGKVVSSGALVAQTSQTIDTNGTYDTTLKDEIVVNVSGGGGSAYELVASKEVTVEVGTSTSATNVGSLSIPMSYFTDKMMLIVIRDKNGPQLSHFYFSVAIKPFDDGGTTPQGRIAVRHNANASNVILTPSPTSSAMVGVFVDSIQWGATTGYAYIKAKYNATTTLELDGTYVVEVYAVSKFPNVTF